MGAVKFVEKIRAMSMSKAYTKAVEHVEEEHGHEQGYSGAINSTDHVQDVTKEYESSKTPLPKYIDMMIENASKRDCYGICLEKPKANDNKIKTQVENIVVKGTTKWVLKYVVYEMSVIGLMEDHQIGSCDTKGEAITLGRAHTEKTGRRTHIHMEKVLEKGSSLVAKITYKTSSNEKDGLYVLFGLAPD